MSQDEGFNISVSPNPVHSEAVFELSLPGDGIVSLSIFDVNGKSVQPILNKPLKKGCHKIDLNCSPFSVGTYFYVADYETLTGILSRRTGKIIK